MRLEIPIVLLICGVLLAAVPNSASASIAHPGVVSANPADYTPWLVSTPAVPRPHVDALGRIGDTVFAGGWFDRVAHPGGAPAYTRNNFMAFDATNGAMKTTIVPNFNAQVWAIEAVGNICRW